MRTSPLIRIPCWSRLHEDAYKSTPEMRTPPLIRTLLAVHPMAKGVQNRGVPLYTALGVLTTLTLT